MDEHIAEIDFPTFYASALPSAKGVREFVECIRKIPADKSKAKIVLHQAARMIWMADRIETFAKGRPAFQVFFYLVAAEAVAKLVSGYNGDGQSRKHVKLFFGDICTRKHRDTLSRAFSSEDNSALSWDEAVDLLYEVRCDVVHEGRYFDFTLKQAENAMDILTQAGGKKVFAKLTTITLRRVVIEGALLGAHKALPQPSDCGQPPQLAV